VNICAFLAFLQPHGGDAPFTAKTTAEKARMAEDA
jgi:hypothetical protein